MKLIFLTGNLLCAGSHFLWLLCQPWKDQIMKLMTIEIESKLPALYHFEKTGTKPIAMVKFFDPTGSWTWYVAEGRKQPDGDWLFWGAVDGFECQIILRSFSKRKLWTTHIDCLVSWGIVVVGDYSRYWTGFKMVGRSFIIIAFILSWSHFWNRHSMHIHFVNGFTDYHNVWNLSLKSLRDIFGL